MRHRTGAVLFLCAISMTGCFLWFGRLNQNVPSNDQAVDFEDRIIDRIIDLPDKKAKKTPPPYLFQSDQYSDNDDDDETQPAQKDGEDENYHKGERIRSRSVDNKPKEEGANGAAKSMDVSLPVTSDSAVTAPPPIDYSEMPKLVWLMSYPNSGTSYTMTMVARASNRATASNYGKEVTEPGSYSTPLYPGHWNGPYYQPREDKPLPRDYILVKTHCGGRCVTCGPDEYVTNQFEFLQECTRGAGAIPPPENRGLEDVTSSSSMDLTTDYSISDEFKYVHYDASLVTKAVHLYRNIFHNIVSRFHLERKHGVQANKKSYIEKYTNDPAGFQRWCKDLNKQYGPSKEAPPQHVLQDDVVQLMKDVPCHGEVYKYTQWHNMANAITTQSMKSTLVLHYENYEAKWNETAGRILDFLHLDMEGTQKPFSARHDYDPYFTASQRNATRMLVERLATEPVWKQLQRYF